MQKNRQVLLVERPRYITPTANCFRLAEGAMPPPLQDGEVLLRTTWLAMESSSYSRVKRITALQKDPIKLKEPMLGSAIGRVEQSRNARFKAGDLVSGLWSWSDYVVAKGERLRNLDFGPQKPSYALGAFGLSGFGAYIALDSIAPPQAGETVVTGTALGSLGHLAGQIAKLKGCRVVGIAGTAEKCQLAVSKLGFDACVNRQSKTFESELRAACPQGVDVYLETLGGRALDATLPLMNIGGRIAAIGQAATPHFGEGAHEGRLQNTLQFMAELIARRLSIRGLITSDHVKGRVKDFDNTMKGWIDSGQVKPLEDITEGLEKAPDALQSVFEGKNHGSRLVKVAD
ncbi:MAG: NADP-dependent oxidoreductase [Pseudomonadota bacterium]